MPQNWTQEQDKSQLINSPSLDFHIFQIHHERTMETGNALTEKCII